MKITLEHPLVKAVDIVYLNGNPVTDVIEFETGPRGYVSHLEPRLPRLPDGCFATVTKRGSVAVKFIDGTFIE